MNSIDNDKKNGKVLIFSAPSGAGKSTIVKFLMQKFPNLGFSVSATSRLPRGAEIHGVDYFFLTPEQFKNGVNNGDFVEYEEVYDGLYYGTLKSEVDRIWSSGKIVVFDIDVKGGVNLKNMFGVSALSVFIKPPSIEHLKDRLIGRGTENMESIEKRVARAEEELTYQSKFDVVLLNDDLEVCLAESEILVRNFINR